MDSKELAEVNDAAIALEDEQAEVTASKLAEVIGEMFQAMI